MDVETMALSISIFSLSVVTGLLCTAICHLKNFRAESSFEEILESEEESEEESTSEDVQEPEGEKTDDGEWEDISDSEEDQQSVVDAISSNNNIEKAAESLLTVSMKLRDLVDNSGLVSETKKQRLLEILDIASSVVSRTVEIGDDSNDNPDELNSDCENLLGMIKNIQTTSQEEVQINLQDLD